TFRITDMQQANRLYQRITGKPLKGKPNEKLATKQFSGAVSTPVPGQTKATNASRAKSLSNFQSDYREEATVNIPIETVDAEYVAEIPVEPSRNNWSPLKVGERQAYTDGGMLLVADKPLGPDQKDLQPIRSQIRF